MARRYGARPSQFVAIADPLMAYQFDEAIYGRGVDHEAEIRRNPDGRPPPTPRSGGRLGLNELRQALRPGGQGLTFIVGA
jgi:hypothetical protein